MEKLRKTTITGCRDEVSIHLPHVRYGCHPLDRDFLFFLGGGGWFILEPC
jgi:hypothetical protein